MRRSAILLGALFLTACTGAPEGPPPEQSKTGESQPAADQAPENPFHRQADDFLREGRVDDAITALRSALKVDPLDLHAHILLGGLLLDEDPNMAARHIVQALRDRSEDCILALQLAVARRRVDRSAGSEPVLRDVLAYAGCPVPAYGIAAERLARAAEEDVAGARLPEGGPTQGPRTIRTIALTDGPGFAALAAAVHERWKGRLTVLGDRFVDLSERHRVQATWLAEDLVLLDARVAPGEEDPDEGITLERAVGLTLAAWLDRKPALPPHEPWRVDGWTEYRDVRGRFRLEVPDGWYASVFESPRGSVILFAPQELATIDDPAVVSGRIPSWSLALTSHRPGDPPPPWTNERIDSIVASISRPFAGAEHATELEAEMTELAEGRVPAMIMKRAFVKDGVVYRVLAVEAVGPRDVYRFAFAGPAGHVGPLEDDFLRFVRSLELLDS